MHTLEYARGNSQRSSIARVKTFATKIFWNAPKKIVLHFQSSGEESYA